MGIARSTVTVNVVNQCQGLTGTEVLGSECSWERILLRTKVPGNLSSRAILLRGTKG